MILMTVNIIHKSFILPINLMTNKYCKYRNMQRKVHYYYRSINKNLCKIQYIAHDVLHYRNDNMHQSNSITIIITNTIFSSRRNQFQSPRSPNCLQRYKEKKKEFVTGVNIDILLTRRKKI